MDRCVDLRCQRLRFGLRATIHKTFRVSFTLLQTTWLLSSWSWPWTTFPTVLVRFLRLWEKFRNLLSFWPSNVLWLLVSNTQVLVIACSFLVLTKIKILKSATWVFFIKFQLLKKNLWISDKPENCENQVCLEN